MRILTIALVQSAHSLDYPEALGDHELVQFANVIEHLLELDDLGSSEGEAFLIHILLQPPQGLLDVDSAIQSEDASGLFEPRVLALVCRIFTPRCQGESEVFVGVLREVDEQFVKQGDFVETELPARVHQGDVLDLDLVKGTHELVNSPRSLVHLGSHGEVVPFIDGFLVRGNAVLDHQESCLTLAEDSFRFFVLESVEGFSDVPQGESEQLVVEGDSRGKINVLRQALDKVEGLEHLSNVRVEKSVKESTLNVRNASVLAELVDNRLEARRSVVVDSRE